MVAAALMLGKFLQTCIGQLPLGIGRSKPSFAS
jgi:hypothetical protein